MKSKTTLSWALLLLFAMPALAPAVSCGRKARPTVAADVRTNPRPSGTATASDRPGPTAAPTVTLAVDPATIKPGETTRLTWTSTNAETLIIDGAVGTVAENGSVQVSPMQSTTYTATASNRLGASKASARVTVAAADDSGPVITSTRLDQTDLGLEEALKRGEVRDIFFAFDQYSISDEARPILEANARALRRFPNTRIVIEGHCDERGTEEYNLALGDRRANAVKEYLVSLGIAASRIDTISYGEERPFATGQDEASWAQNRRAHFRAAR